MKHTTVSKLEQISLSEVRPLLEKLEEFATVLNDKELLNSTLQGDLGCDSPSAFLYLAKGLGIYSDYPTYKTLIFYKKEYSDLTVEGYIKKINELIQTGRESVPKRQRSKR